MACTLGVGLGEMMFDRVGVTGERFTGNAYGEGAEAGDVVSVRVDAGCACVCARIGGCGVDCEPGSARPITGEPLFDAVTTGRVMLPG